MTTLQSHHPDVLLVNYKEPDVSGHANNWGKYLLGIQNTDKYVHEVWDFIQNDPYYKDQTTLIITNDHGRHDDGWKDGFVSHGDNCDGCRHISLLALGPDIKKNYVSTNDYSQIDITSTIASIFQIQMPFVKGKLMEDIFIKNQK
jgi:bisphosphoglycerate-independent phosphoglycerate mutase (AlkP superfamily)